jgi:hypothetical protein|tara:strand:+ start:4572 stop:5312 length:741 start_codon:yes stop_codon:yes gene_type:complete
MFNYTNMFEELDTDSLKVQDDLDRQVWEADDKIKPEISERLLKIARDFINQLGLDKFEIQDIVLTGSLAAYNWSKYSDFDLHIILDFAQIDENIELVKDFLNAKKGAWNREHMITIGGYEVELYFENRGEPHESPGVYSLKYDKWNTKPENVTVRIDMENSVKKAEDLVRQIDDAEKFMKKEKYDKAIQYAKKIKDKIKKMRQSGLEERGVYSVENLAFKLLRRSGDIGRLLDVINDSYDKKMSIS